MTLIPLHVADAPIASHGRSLNLIKDICTQWNSTLFILQRCILLKDPINHVLAESKYVNLVPSAEQRLSAVCTAKAISNSYRLFAG